MLHYLLSRYFLNFCPLSKIAKTQARNIPDFEDTWFINPIDCRKRCNNLAETYFGNAVLNAIAVANVGALLGNGASYAVRSIQSSFQVFTSEHIQLISNMMEQQKQFAFNANVPLDKDVKVT
jgi:hypothetical protein